MRIEVSKSDIIWSYLSIIISMSSGFLILPFVLKCLDDLSIGLYYVFISLNSISTLFDFGFSASFSRNIAYCWSGSKQLSKEGLTDIVNTNDVDYALMKKVLFTSKLVYSLLAFFALLLGLTIGTVYVLHISSEIDGYLHIIAWFVYAFTIFLNIYYGYYISYLRGVGAVQTISRIIAYLRIFQVVFTAIILLNGGGLLGIGIANFIYCLFFRFTCKKAFYNYSGIGKHLNMVNEKETINNTLPLFKTIWHNAWREGVISLSNFLSNQAGTVICSIYYTLPETGLYSLSMQLTSGVAVIASTMYSAYEPSLQSAYVHHDREKQKSCMSVIVITYILLFIFGMLMLLLIGLPIISWLRPSYAISIQMILLAGFYQFILRFRNCYTTFFSSTNRLYYMRSFIISAFLSVILTVIFAEMTNLRIWGFLIAQIVSQALFNMWYWTIKVHQELQLSINIMLRYTHVTYKQLLKHT